MEQHDPFRDWGRVGRYRILGTLGQGGMGCLYLARSEGPGGFERLAALKMIHEHLSREPAFVEMFLEEARIAARIHHPNVVTVYEIGQHDGRHFIAMDYIHGETLTLTLSRRWKTRETFPLEIAAHVVASTAEGLHRAHELCDTNGRALGVVHRDVSPANIMIGYDGTIRVMDFGIAKAADRIVRTRTGVTKGKASYMAPEQIRDEPLDRRVDIFAMGIVLWEATCGKRLFKASSEIATISRIMTSDIPKPSMMRADYPKELERIVMKALAPNARDRYPTARALAQDLRDFAQSHSRLPSAVDIENFMRDTFPDRHATRASMMERAERLPAPRRGSGSSRDDGPSLSNVPSDGARRSFVDQLDGLIAEELADDGLEATSALPSSSSQSNTTDSSRMTGDLPAAAFVEPMGLARFSRGRAAGLAVALLGLGVALGLFARGSGSGGDVLAVSAPERAEFEVVDPTAPARDAELSRVVISFATTPAAAALEIDGKSHEGPLIVDRSDRVYRVHVSAPGYDPIELAVTGDRSQRIEVALEKPQSPKVERRSRGSGRGGGKAGKTKKPVDGLVSDIEL